MKARKTMDDAENENRLKAIATLNHERMRLRTSTIGRVNEGERERSTNITWLIFSTGCPISTNLFKKVYSSDDIANAI